jgi:26S proteasome regulatory subunit N9
MKALSLDLVRGSIDEIEHKIYITWVQPRVLDGEQVNLKN